MEAQKIELILFYADWCPWCQAISGTPNQAWNQLEAIYENHPTVQIRKIAQRQVESYYNEATTYEKPQVNAFPMIIRVEGKNCQVYDSTDRSVDDFKRFIEQPTFVNTCIIL